MADESATTLHTLQLFMERLDGKLEASLSQFGDRLSRIERKTDALHKIVAGNGSDTSLVMRQTLSETRLAHLEQEVVERCMAAAAEREALQAQMAKRLEEHEVALAAATAERKKEIAERDAKLDQLQVTLEAWRNRAIGIGLALSIFGGIAALVGARLLQLFQTP